MTGVSSSSQGASQGESSMIPSRESEMKDPGKLEEMQLFPKE